VTRKYYPLAPASFINQARQKAFFVRSLFYILFRISLALYQNPLLNDLWPYVHPDLARPLGYRINVVCCPARSLQPPIPSSRSTKHFRYDPGTPVSFFFAHLCTCLPLCRYRRIRYYPSQTILLPRRCSSLRFFPPLSGQRVPADASIFPPYSFRLPDRNRFSFPCPKCPP